jgi:murein DD-endopeptidase MepM/ murein hydrolase activator NlpD
MGEVVDVRNDVEDNPQGTANYGDNWGNYVMVRMHCGDHVLLAHLQQGSVAVVPGQRVSYTSFLGSVGNSGRSTVAHLHMQVQADRTLGAPTKPFS